MTTPRRITLDPAAPLRSLRDALGLLQTDVAAARGVGQGSVSEAESARDGTSVRTLVATAAALGYRVRLVAERVAASPSPAPPADHPEATAPLLPGERVDMRSAVAEVRRRRWR